MADLGSVGKRRPADPEQPGGRQAAAGSESGFPGAVSRWQRGPGHLELGRLGRVGMEDQGFGHPVRSFLASSVDREEGGGGSTERAPWPPAGRRSVRFEREGGSGAAEAER
jgi:hypothetical protein